MRVLAVLLALWALPALAVEPGEMLDDPVLEERARELSAGLRCPICRNESIDESNAQLSAELRLVVRDRLLAGDTNQEVLDYLVARYGEYVLLKPTLTGTNIILWAAAPALLLLALGIGWQTIRRRNFQVEAPLSADEKAALEKILEP